MKVGDDLVYVDCSLPSTDNFLPWTELLALHRDLVKAKSIEASVTHGSLLGSSIRGWRHSKRHRRWSSSWVSA